MIIPSLFSLFILSNLFASSFAASEDSSGSSDKRKAEQDHLDHQYWQHTKALDHLHKQSQSAPENSGSKHAIDEAFRVRMRHATANEERQLQLQREEWAARAEAKKKTGR